MTFGNFVIGENSDRAYREFIADTVPLRDAWLARPAPHVDTAHALAVFRPDVKSRPDIRDLWRVQQPKGPRGKVNVRWDLFLGGGELPTLARLELEFTRPVHCEFRLLVNVQSYRAVLDQAARTQYIGLTLRARPAGSTNDPILLINHEPDSLAKQLALVDLGEMFSTRAMN